MSIYQQLLASYPNIIALPSDPYFANVILLMHADGANGGIVFTDSSISPKILTRAGNAVTSSAQLKFGTSSLFLDGTLDSLTLPTSSVWAIGNNNFTIECWAYVNVAAQTAGFFSSVQTPSTINGVLLGINGGKIVGRIANNSVVVQVVSPTNVVLNTWTHIAFVKNGSTYTLFQDGISIGTPVTNAATPDSTVASIGRFWSNNTGSTLNGYIDDLRVTSGVARYTANFTPPVIPFLDR